MNNCIGIDLKPFAGSHPGTIENSEIGAPSLISPYSGRFGYAGLRADGITGGITVGRTSSSYGSAGSYNFIHDQEYGLLFTRSIAYVQNNWIKDIRTYNAPPGFGTGVGVAAAGTTSAANQVLYVGFPDIGVTGVNNRIEDCEKGVFALGIQQAVTNNNEIIGSGGADPTMNQGVWYQDVLSSIISRNTITEFDSICIYVKNIGTVKVDSNVLNSPTIVSNGSCRITGIELRTGVISSFPEVTFNRLNNLQFGIAVLSTNALIEHNEVNFRLPTSCSGEFAIGIQAENSGALQIIDNEISGSCGGCGKTKIRGIDITESQEFWADRNRIEDCGVGAAAHGDCQGGNFTCNQLFDCDYGFALVGMDDGGMDVGPVTDQLSLLNGAGNYWAPEPTANRTIAVTSSSGIPTYGTPPPPALTPPIIDWRYDASYGLGSDMAPITTFNLQTGGVSPTGSRRIAPLTPGSSVTPCDFIPRFGFRTLDFPSQKGRNSLFAAFSDVFSRLDLSTCNYFEEKSYSYNFFADNPDWLNLGVEQDEEYIAVMDGLAEGNYDDWYTFFRYLKFDDKDSALTVLRTILPNCAKEQERINIFQIYIDRKLDTLSFDQAVAGAQYYLTADWAELSALALQDPNDKGDAVYYARSILGMNSLSPIDTSGLLRASSFAKDKPAITLSPNPAHTTLCIFGLSVNAIDEIAYKVYDLRGHVVFSGTLNSSTTSCLDVHALVDGLYMLHINFPSQKSESHSFIVADNSSNKL